MEKETTERNLREEGAYNALKTGQLILKIIPEIKDNEFRTNLANQPFFDGLEEHVQFALDCFDYAVSQRGNSNDYIWRGFARIELLKNNPDTDKKQMYETAIPDIEMAVSLDASGNNYEILGNNLFYYSREIEGAKKAEVLYKAREAAQNAARLGASKLINYYFGYIEYDLLDYVYDPRERKEIAKSCIKHFKAYVKQSGNKNKELRRIINELTKLLRFL